MLCVLCYNWCRDCMPVLQFCNCWVSTKHNGFGEKALPICKNQLHFIMQYITVSWYKGGDILIHPKINVYCCISNTHALTRTHSHAHKFTNTFAHSHNTTHMHTSHDHKHRSTCMYSLKAINSYIATHLK